MFSISEYVNGLLSPVRDIIHNGTWVLLLIPFLLISKRLFSVLHHKFFMHRVAKVPPSSCSLCFLSKKELLTGYQEWMERRANEKENIS